MYKVFYNDRIVFFTDEFKENFENLDGLFYKYKERVELSFLLNLFQQVRGINRLYIYHPDIDYAFNEFKSLFKCLDAAGGLVINRKNQFLAIHRRGFWDLPKGKTDDGESQESAALREVKEETGVQHINIEKLITETYHTYLIDNTPILKKTYWYLMKNAGEKLIPQQEEGITEALWMPYHDISKFTDNTFESLKEVLKKSRLFKLK